MTNAKNTAKQINELARSIRTLKHADAKEVASCDLKCARQAWEAGRFESAQRSIDRARAMVDYAATL